MVPSETGRLRETPGDNRGVDPWEGQRGRCRPLVAPGSATASAKALGQSVLSLLPREAGAVRAKERFTGNGVSWGYRAGPGRALIQQSKLYFTLAPG